MPIKIEGYKYVHLGTGKAVFGEEKATSGEALKEFKEIPLVELLIVRPPETPPKPVYDFDKPPPPGVAFVSFCHDIEDSWWSIQYTFLALGENETEDVSGHTNRSQYSSVRNFCLSNNLTPVWAGKPDNIYCPEELREKVVEPGYEASYASDLRQIASLLGSVEWSLTRNDPEYVLKTLRDHQKLLRGWVETLNTLQGK